MEDRYGRRTKYKNNYDYQKGCSTLFTIGASIVLLIGAIVGINSCITYANTMPTLQQATSKLLLADVTSAGSGKYGKTTESYWYDPTRIGYIVRCFHDNDLSNLTADSQNCEHFAIPTQLPNSATFLAINMGSGELTQSVWALPNLSMVICNHNDTFWDNTSTSISSCTPFARPKEVDPSATLISINAGNNIKAQSFWSDGHVCLHVKANDGGWFSKDGFGSSQRCTLFTFDTSKFPNGAVNPKLEAVTSDASRPWETFWQDQNGTLIRCKHNGSNDNWFSSETLGPVDHCDFWRAPRL